MNSMVCGLAPKQSDGERRKDPREQIRRGKDVEPTLPAVREHEKRLHSV
jgi:hypothetical protein